MLFTTCRAVATGRVLWSNTTATTVTDPSKKISMPLFTKRLITTGRVRAGSTSANASRTLPCAADLKKFCALSDSDVILTLNVTLSVTSAPRKVGDCDGDNVGETVGETDGDTVGDNVGVDVGDVVGD